MNGDLCTSFHEACLKLGLLENNNHYYLAMQQASLSNLPSTICMLFVVILAWCEPSNPSKLYDSFKDAMAEDLKKGTALCKLIQDCKAIVIDEAPMTHKAAMEA